MQIQNGTNVEQTAGGVTIITRLQTERFHDRFQTTHVIGQLGWANGCIFDKRNRFCRPDAAGQKRETGFAHQPNQTHLRWIGKNFLAQPELSRLQERQSFWDVFVELDEQNRFAGLRIQFKQIARCLKMKLFPGLIEQWPVDMFDRCRSEVDKLDCGLHRFIHRREKDQSQTFFARQRRDS